MFSSSRPTLRAGILIAVFISTACKQGTREPAGWQLHPRKWREWGRSMSAFSHTTSRCSRSLAANFGSRTARNWRQLLKQPAPTAARPSGDTPAGMNPGLYEYRPPLDLTQARLRKLAAALDLRT